ncbi:MAG: phosphoheptose isomerase [Bacteroidetes bacterium GWF2_42_66]|nr:MAG: phosphoheptose isomerase [Bacteroidetes bacterium GWA2_42_15]OFY01912.1 MAG: phosphoheptose isomerase [Bacteroidetes bacterium GWE2_42_39]OFY44792.1 MAG: phosphoheptose isomerase [Bacteroidetes bacterium GWF2_42_66]HBL75919.1 phosphoheptose isomerase [Prolixibacteraceae bacterium]HCR89166.1 phosphoheptose isomerase [Prolixibacteraceae bacterium]
MIEPIKKDFADALEMLKTFINDELNLKAIEKAALLMVNALRNGNKIISCGNGGSLCDAIHFAEELTGRFQLSRRPLPAIAISDPAHITCVANDFGFGYVFSRYVESVGKPGDILLAISTSGNSENIKNAILAARKNAMQVVALTGKTGGETASMCDVEIRAPYSEFSDRAQEIHTKIIHSLVHSIELELFPELYKNN